MSGLFYGNLPPGAPIGAKRPSEVLLLVDLLKTRAAAEMRAVFPGHLKRYRDPPAAGVQPLEGAPRLTTAARPSVSACACWHSRAGGADRAIGQRLADFAQDLVDLFWPAEQEDPLQLSVLEQRRQGHADPLQLQFQGGDAAVVPDLLDGLRAHRSAIGSLIRALDALLPERQVAA